MTFTSVDLPAPLSPTSATISPAWTSTDAPRKACPDPKDFRIFRIEISGTPRFCEAPLGRLESVIVTSTLFDVGQRGRCPNGYLLVVLLADRRLLNALADLLPGPDTGLHDITQVVLRDVGHRQEHRGNVHELVVDLAVDQLGGNAFTS